MLAFWSQVFRNGGVLLLDELNLASDEVIAAQLVLEDACKHALLLLQVLRCLELALDTGELHLRDQAPTEEPLITRHADFRLIATQNPATGSFRGKRERLSQELLSRFTLIAFKELSPEEWEQVRLH